MATAAEIAALEAQAATAQAALLAATAQTTDATANQQQGNQNAIQQLQRDHIQYIKNIQESITRHYFPTYNINQSITLDAFFNSF